MKQEWKCLALALILCTLGAMTLGCNQQAIEATATVVTTSSAVTPTAEISATAAPSVGSTATPSSTPAPASKTTPPTVTATATPKPTSLSVSQWVAAELTFNSSAASGDTSASSAKLQEGFESSTVPKNWNHDFGGTLSVSTTVAHAGTRSLCCSSRTQVWECTAFNMYDYVKKQGAGYYQISFWIYADKLSATPSASRLLIRGKAADANSFIRLDGTNYFAVLNSVPALTAKKWINVTGSVEIAASDITRATGNFNVILDELDVVSGQKIYFDDFSIQKTSKPVSADDVEMDVIFTGPNNTTLTMPAFWDGGTTWKVRFAPTKVGTWTYKTVCSDTKNTGLHNKSGTINCTAYKGNLDIYKHGFVVTASDKKYFTYADGTPFFYLGDTHWNMPATPFDTSEVAGISSTFKYIVDERVKQGFTVYQSEPLDATYDLSNGLSEADLESFRDLDRRFKYIADAGMLHTNVQFFFVTEFINNASKYSAEYLDSLCRYWVARYAAYPVLWTTGQECDTSPTGAYSKASKLWQSVLQSVNKYDPYKHPSTAHQDNTNVVRASTSAFRNLSGHKWYAAQWSPTKNGQLDFSVPKDYWNNGQGKPAVNYEGFYDHLWTNEYGARMQGWTAYLNGMYGHGYGAIDIWLYNSTYDTANATVRDGITVTVADKKIKWNESIHFNAAYQMGYMHTFLSKIEWWKLTPRFDDTAWFQNNGSWYSVASKSNDLYVAYFYNTTQKTGTLKGLANVTYTAQWFNPRTNAYGTVSSFTPASGTYAIGNKPDTGDWVLIVKKK